MIKYNNGSPYVNTPQTSWYLGYWEPIEITKSLDDKYYKIPSRFNLRPDLAAYALYNSPQYWWVFAARNKDILKDPIFDFKSGTIALKSL